MRVNSIAILLLIFSSAAAHAQCPYLEQELDVSAPVDGDWFGHAMDSTADTLVVGAPGAAFPPPDYDGVVFVYRRVGDRWEESATLVAEDGSSIQGFAFSVAVAGDWVAVGAPTDADLAVDAGAVYLFQRDGDRWSQMQKLFAPDAAAGARFGFSLDVWDDVLVVGSLDDGEAGVAAGAAHVFQRDGTDWSWSQKLLASDAEEEEWFGYSVAASRERIVIGAPGRQIFEKEGAAYVFGHDGVSWFEEQRLLAEDPTILDFFGFSVGTDEDTAVVGAIGDRTTGSASVFRRTDRGWNLVQTLTPEGEDTNVWFGHAVSVDGPLIGVSAPLIDGGQVFVHRADGTGWFEEARLESDQVGSSAEFGRSLTLYDSTFGVGAPGGPFPSQPGQGFVYQGDGLELTIEPDPVRGGDDAIWELRGGDPDQWFGIWLTNLDGSRVLQRLGLFRFGGDGEWSQQGSVPPALSGHTLTFLGIGFSDCGYATWSNPEDLTVQ